MSDLKIPNLNKPKQYLFKNKIDLKRKSKSKLFTESFLMISLSFLILVINYLIPNKTFLFQSFFNNLKDIFSNFVVFLGYFFEVLIVLFIILSLISSLILVFGGIYRLLRIKKRKTKSFTFR